MKKKLSFFERAMLQTLAQHYEGGTIESTPRQIAILENPSAMLHPDTTESQWQKVLSGNLHTHRRAKQ